MCVGEGATVCGEEYKKEDEEIVFYVVVVQKQESDREMNSVLFATRPSRSPLFRAFHTQPESCSPDTDS